MLPSNFLRFISISALRAAIVAPAASLAVLMGAAPSTAQQSAALAAYPVKTIRIIVASSPGTASDFFARSLGEELGAFYRQRVAIENRPGAGGLIRSEERRVGKECRSRWSADHEKKKEK